MGLKMGLKTALGTAVVLAVWMTPASGVTATCAAGANPVEPPSYYAIELVPTRRVPGTGTAIGVVAVTSARSPFGIALTPDGEYVSALDIRLERLRLPRNGAFVAWSASADLEHVEQLGVVGADLRVRGQVAWNKFLVIISLESSADSRADRWQGPIVMRGMSRSGMMHTMAGHGPFEAEPCVKYGYR